MTSVYRLADNFTDPAFTSSRWNLNSFGTGVSAAEQKGRLEFSITPDVVFDDGVNTVDQHYGTNCYLKGNFDARIRFRLLSWPKRDGVLVSFGVYFAPPHEAFWSISRTGALDWRSEGYYSWLDDSPGFAPAADRSGVLRLRRQNGVLTVYYRDRRGWAMLDAGDAVGPASLVVMLAAHPDDFGHQAASAAFDRFQATATSVNCPPGTPLPPRRSRRIES